MLGPHLLRALPFLAARIQAISQEQFNLDKDAKDKWILSDTTLRAIQLFREAFDRLHPKIIYEGYHFRSNSLQETCDAYRNAIPLFGHDWRKYALFEDGVLSRLLMKVSANQAMDFSQGLYHLQVERKACSRSLIMRDKNHYSQVLHGSSPDFSLPFSCVDIIFGACAEGGLVFAEGGWAFFSRLQNYHQTCAQQLGEFMRGAKHPVQAGPMMSPRATS